jgi:hypothetical protein
MDESTEQEEGGDLSPNFVNKLLALSGIVSHMVFRWQLWGVHFPNFIYTRS